MAALTTLLPVFAMLALGFVSRIMGWVTPEQKAGANDILFGILFPVLIFNLLATAQLSMSVLPLILYVLAMYMVAILVIGPLTAKFTGEKNAHFSKFLLATSEGGNVALPLFLSVVAGASNTVIYDIASTVIAFIVVPIMVARAASGGASAGKLLVSIVTNPFIIAVALGILLNLTGLYGALLASPFGAPWSATISMITSPIVGLILFCLGYDLKVDKDTLGPILKLGAVRLAWGAVILVGLFLFFGSLMAQREWLIASLLYFTCPTGFGLAPMLMPLYRSKDEAGFTSAFMSIYIIVTLVMYTFIVLFMA